MLFNKKYIHTKLNVLIFFCFVSLSMLSTGCSKKTSVNNTSAAENITSAEQNSNLDSENSDIELDIEKCIDLNAVNKVVNNKLNIDEPDQLVLSKEFLYMIKSKHYKLLDSAVEKYNIEYDKCVQSLNLVVQDESACYSDERVILNIIMEEIQRIEWLEQHGQNDIQRSLWRILNGIDYYSFRLLYSDELNSGDNDKSDVESVLMQLVQAGADLNVPNWDGNIGAFAVDNIQLIAELVKSGIVKYDVKNKDGSSLLHKYAYSQDDVAYEAMLDLLVKSGLNIDSVNNEGQTPLFFVKSPRIAEKFVKAGANINHEDHLGNTPIFYAAKIDDKDFSLSSQFVRLGADINHLNHQGQTPVYGVNVQNDIQKFVNLGANLALKDKNGNTPLINYDISSDSKELDNLNAYLKNGVDIKYVDDFPILKLCLENDIEWNRLNKLCIDMLIKNGADIFAEDREGLNFLSYVLKNSRNMDDESYKYARNDLKLKYGKNLNVVDILADVRSRYDEQEEYDVFSSNMEELSDELSYAERAVSDMMDDGVLNLTERTQNGKTLLFYVKNDGLASKLIKAGIDINAKSKNGRTALWNGNIGELIKAGADVNVVDNHGETALFSHYKYYLGSDFGTSIAFNPVDVELLLEAGADINAKDSFGRTMLFYVIEQCDGWGTDEECEESEYCDAIQGVKFLADRGADVNIKDNDGVTPLMVVCKSIKTDTEEFVLELIKLGADVNAKDNAGRTAADYCMQNENLSAVDILKQLD